jgi:hypothetical protein
MQQVEFKKFRDSKNKLFLSYWNMNKGEIFITCDLLNIPLGDDNQIEDYGCTFVTSGSFTYQEMDSDTLITAFAGDSLNRRPQKSILIRALEDNTNWCFAVHSDTLFTIDKNKGTGWECSKTPIVLNGEQIKIMAGETITVVDLDKDIYIANPICESEPNTISYKSSEEENFTSLDFGKYLKIAQGKTFNIQSTLDTYLPKIYYTNPQQ